jgi:3-methyladenine DNA glycosylase AlkC
MTIQNDKAFKHSINQETLKKLSCEISSVYPEFQGKKLLKISEQLMLLELKERVMLVANCLRELLPEDYLRALSILVQVMEKDNLKGFELWPFSEYIGRFGLEHFKESLMAMVILTSRFTAEFAVRPFILKNHIKVLKFLMKCTQHKNFHVRRWASEGSRPLLPWGERLPLFIMDPTHTLHLLEKLKYDPELYVRKSVANHLNDISKNHPQIVVEVIRSWISHCPEVHLDKVEWIQRHALRTLIKKGYAPALTLMGVSGRGRVEVLDLSLNQDAYALHDKLIFNLKLRSISKMEEKFIIDYKIDFVKANGSKGVKTFKLKSLRLSPGEIIILHKTHSLKPITTMKYYTGTHHLMIQVNGKVVKQVDFHFNCN